MLQGKYKSFFLGPNKLIGLLGSGDSCRVYLAGHTTFNSLRAVKVLPEKQVAEGSFLSRFINLARVFGQLNHPNIVQVLDILAEGRIHFIVMEYIEGRDLQAIVTEGGPLGHQEAADLIRQAAKGLDFAHQKGVVHCRVNPSNLMLDAAGNVKILSTIAAEFVDNELPLPVLEIDQQNHLTTAGFLAPEEASDQYFPNHREDIYSLGCTFYFLLTGQPPFPQKTVPQRIYGHLRESPESIYKIRPDAPRELVELCEWMMQKSPDARPQTMQEVLASLDGFCAL